MNSVRQYWSNAYSGLQALERELNKGTAADSSKLDRYYEDVRPLSPGEFACSLCDRTKEAYNLVHGTTYTQTFEEMCVAEGCPGLQSCRYDPKKWEVFQALACVWYFKEGQFFTGEGNRYPLCQRFCQDFGVCESTTPTNPDFSPLDYAHALSKQTRCIHQMYRIAVTDSWADTVISSWGG